MKTQLFSKAISIISAATLAAVFTAITPVSADGTASRLERLKSLQSRIDSLEVEKQIKKRNGMSLDELEEKTSLARDTIKMLRLELQDEPQSIAAQQPVRPRGAGAFSILKNFSLFDRILIASGCLTILLIILAILLKAVARRRKNALAARYQVQKATKRYESVMRQEPVPPPADTGSQRRDTVREVALPPAAPQPPRKDGERKSAASLNDLVLRAHREGLDAKEISLRHHISVDQVELIVKMAERQ